MFRQSAFQKVAPQEGILYGLVILTEKKKPFPSVRRVYIACKTRFPRSVEVIISVMESFILGVVQVKCPVAYTCDVNAYSLGHV